MDSIVNAVSNCNLQQARQLAQYLKENNQIIQAAARTRVIQLLLVQHDCGIADGFAGNFVNECVIVFSSITLAHASLYYADTVRLSHALATLSCQVRCAKRTIRCLMQLCSVLLSAGPGVDNQTPNTTTMTAVHADVLQVCISAHMYSHALRFIAAHRILSIKPSMHPLSSEDYLRYFYLAGLCCIAVKDFRRAIYYLNEVLLTPAEFISAIAVEAIKKLKLLHLIEYGAEYELPEGISNCIQKLHRRSSEVVRTGIPVSGPMGGGVAMRGLEAAAASLRVYEGIAGAFLRQLEETIESGGGPASGTMDDDMEGDAGAGTAVDSSSVDNVGGGEAEGGSVTATLYELVGLDGDSVVALRADQNLGLAGQCLSALLAHRLTRLGDVFAVLPVADCLTLCRVSISMIQLADAAAAAAVSVREPVDILLQQVERLSHRVGVGTGAACVTIDRTQNTLVFHPELLPGAGEKLPVAAFTAADVTLLKARLDENVRHSAILRTLHTQVLISDAYVRSSNRDQLQQVEQCYSGLSIAGGDPDFDYDM